MRLPKPLHQFEHGGVEEDQQCLLECRAAELPAGGPLFRAERQHGDGAGCLGERGVGRAGDSGHARTRRHSLLRCGYHGGGRPGP